MARTFTNFLPRSGNGLRDLYLVVDPVVRRVLPFATILAWLLAWEAYVQVQGIPPYILPAPTVILETLYTDYWSLHPSLIFTLKLTLFALGAAVASGAIIGTLFAVSPLVETSFFPFAVILQVTPIIAIAPFVMIYVDSIFLALLICAWIVAFFPMLSSTVVGLRSADHNLRSLFQLYDASPWQRFRYLLVPSALPYFLSGLRIAGGLALIGAVVAEFVAGASGRNTGLASRILEAGFRNEVPRMFAALVLIALCGVSIFIANVWLARRLLGHWHESEVTMEK